MDQKQSASATKSGISRRSRQGRKLRNSASANDATIVETRTGMRIEEALLLGTIALLRLLLDLGRLGRRRRLLRAARFLAPILARLGLVRARRPCRALVHHHQHVAAAVDAGGRPAQYPGESMIRIAL